MIWVNWLWVNWLWDRIKQQYNQMNQSEDKFNTRSNLYQSNRSAGVGERQMFLHREAMEWTAVFMEGKFFVADPGSISKLLEIQHQIELQKHLADSNENSEDERAESFHSYHHKIDQANSSYVTEVNLQRQKLNDIKVEEELEREEELYARRIAEARSKKKEERKKGVKNLVKFTKEREDYKSVKMEKLEKEEHVESDLKQSMVNKVPTKREEQPKAEVKLEVVTRRSEKHLAQGKIGNQDGQITNSKLQAEFIHTTTSPKKADNLQKSDKVMAINSIIHIKIGEPINTPPPLASEVNEQKSVVASSVQIINLFPEKMDTSPTKKENPSILSLTSSVQNRISEELKEGRAGDNFFYQLHSRIDEMELNLGEMKEKSPPPQISLPVATHQPIQERIHFKYEPSTTMLNTKELLKDLNHQLKEVGMIEPQQDSFATTERHIEVASNSKILEIQEEGQKTIEIVNESKELKSNEQNPPIDKPMIQIKPEKNLHLQQTVKINLTPLDNQTQQVNKIQKKREHCQLISSLLNHQFVQVAPRIEVNTNQEEKEKLNEEITVLKQVIGELRVERLKYQANSDKVGDESGTLYSNYLKTDRERELIDRGNHRITGSIFNNFTESAVSEVQSNQYRSMIAKKTISGKIVKNISPGKMPKIEEERRVDVKEDEIREEVHETEQHESEDHSRKSTNREESREIMKMQESKSVKIQSEQVSQNIQPEREANLPNNIDFLIVNQSSAIQQIPKMKKGGVEYTIIPLPNSSIKNHSQMQSSMPRPLNRHNHSQPPKFIIQSHETHQKRYESNIKKKLITNFDQLQNDNRKKYATIGHQQKIDPKRRANKDGLLRTVQAKSGSYHPDFNKIVFNQGDTNLKAKIMEIEQSRQQKAITNQGMSTSRKDSMNESKSSRGFRLRRQSEASRQSRVSSTKKQSKSREKGSNFKKQEALTVYVPALQQRDQESIEVPKVEQRSNETKLDAKQQFSSSCISTFKVQKRKINFTLLQVPSFPEAPDSSVKIEEMAQLIKKMNSLLNLQLKQGELHRLIMKKYKNCIMLDLPNARNLKLVWHYSGKLYIGEWNESAMLKEGEGVEHLPGKYYYQGQFMNGKRQGNGIMVQESGSIYEGQWEEGEKNGRGKYYDPSIKLNYEGEWKNSKREGYGYLSIDNQSTYEGTFSENYKDGLGTEQFYNGDSYKGQYSKGRFHGNGIYVWASGDSYEGQFYQGCKHGRGLWTSYVGEIYEGFYKLDKKSGSGRYSWGNGCIYEGQFDNDKKNGNGLLKYPDGREVRGIWKEGKLIQAFESPRKMDRQEPLIHKKNRVIESSTLMKVIQTKPSHQALKQKQR